MTDNRQPVNHQRPGARARFVSVLAVFSIAIAVAFTAQGHDFWIEPSDFRPQPGVPVDLRLRVGQLFLGDAVLRSDAQIERFFARSIEGEQTVTGVDGFDPAGFLQVNKPGLVVVGYRSRPRQIELEAHKFEDYLKLEGLERIVALRGTRGDHAKPGKEQFSRCAKALLAAGNSAKGDFKKPLGFTLELIPEKNPYTLPKGSSLPLRLLYRNAPVEGVLIVAINRAAPAKKLLARTDKQGRVRFALDPDGDWLIKGVHMVPAPSGGPAEWESLWASLTFQTAPRQPGH